MAVNKSKGRQIHMTRENSYYESLDCSVSVYGVTHTYSDLADTLFNSLKPYDFDTVLYEEHIRNGFDPNKVAEHKAIERYKNLKGVPIRSMDVPSNSDEIDSLAEVMSELAPEIPSVTKEELRSEKGMIEYNARYESEYPELYSFAHDFRNDKMSQEIIIEAQNNDVDHVAVVVGKAHMFGCDSIQAKIEKNLDRLFSEI